MAISSPSKDRREEGSAIQRSVEIASGSAQTGRGAAWHEILGGVAALLLAAGLAFVFTAMDVRASVLAAGMLVILMPAGYCLVLRRAVRADRLLLVTLATVCILLAAGYFHWVTPWVKLPADIWIWSESDYVNDIVKFRAGYPLYTPDVNNESFIYPPGSQLLTYFLAGLSLNPTSIPAYRFIHILYAIGAAFMAFLCLRRVLTIAGLKRGPVGVAWGAFAITAMFLLATNTKANWFVHLLHNDSLAQLVTVTAFYLLLCYVEKRSVLLLLCMAALPAAGFFVKQSVVIWGGIYTGYLIVFDRPRSWKRIAGFTVGWTGVLAAAMGVCWLLWGETFFFWTFTVISRHSVSIRRALEHGVEVWPFFLVGFAGAFLLIRSANWLRLAGPWLIWLAIFVTEIYTSGLGWMMNHIGPGSLLAGVWGIAAIAAAWPVWRDADLWPLQPRRMIRVGLVFSAVVVCLFGLGTVSFGYQTYPQQASRYIKDIEKEFEGQDPGKVLLDAGSWIYMNHGIVMKDRVIGIGDRANGGIGDFSGIRGRIKQHTYSKILVRNLHKPDFWYDYYSWKRSSGIRQALLENYREVRTISSALPEGFVDRGGTSVLLSTISVLVPRTGSEPAALQANEKGAQ